MVVSRYDLFKDTLTSDWKKNPTIKKVADAAGSISSPPDSVSKNIYGTGGSAQPAATAPSSDALGLRARSAVNRTAEQPTVGLRRPPLMSAQAPGSPATDRLTETRFTQVAPPNATKVSNVTQLRNGLSLTHDTEGNQIYTKGTPGQDGYGMVKVRPGSAGIQQARAGLLPQGNPGDYTYTTPYNAPQRVVEPVGESTVDMSHRSWLEHSGQGASTGPQMPKPMTLQERAAQGVGWKAARGMYEQQMDAYNKAMANSNALGIASMNKAGENNRALMQDRRLGERNALDQQRLSGEMDVNAARVGSERINQQKGQMEIDQVNRMSALNNQFLAEKDPVKQKALGNQILTIQGKRPNEWQITTREEAIDPNNPMSGMRKVPYAVNLNDPNQVIELGANGNQHEQMPDDKNKLSKGKTYMTPRGAAMWDGEKFTTIGP